MTPTLDVKQLHARLATVVGAEHVSALPDDAHYNGLVGPDLSAAQRPRAVVQPASAEQVQRLAPMIAEVGHSLWHASNACGNGAQAGHRGKPGVLLDLRRMNRIIEVDRRAGCAVIEAGVSFAQLAAHLSERELPLWLDADANGAHAVAGSIGERCAGLTPYGDHQAAQCGLEVVLANGTLLRTGMGALPGSDCWPRYKHNFGPALDGLFSRAHFGIVTKLGLWLMPAPPRFLPFMAALPDLATAASLVERLRPLLLDGTLTGSVLLASRACDAALLERAGGQAGHAAASPWTLYGALYGLADEVEFHWQTLRGATGGTQLSSAGNGAAWQLRRRQLRGESLYSDASGQHDSVLSFSVVAPPSAPDVLALHHGVLARLAEFAPRLSFQLAPRLLTMTVAWSASDAEHEVARKGALAAIGDLVKLGYGLRHSAPALEATLAARHTHAGLRHLYNGLHTALDPYAVLAARGKFKRGKG